MFGIAAKRPLLGTAGCAVPAAGREVLVAARGDKTTEGLAGLCAWMPCSWPFSLGWIGEPLPGLAQKLPSDFQHLNFPLNGEALGE